ncbi:uncharacterized protein LOC124543062 [Vanessa cardui]|uniref:uncharacterized protein LOC124543062 n=1 Tax=Vanessa cardui TaxID=171605 RepID=UPI001F1485F2|nr:uncharacterized protein LOC124543062 [Vanessa cardui]
MTRIQCFYLVFAIILSADAINRSVYKIVLSQKGFAQFLQYDLETPPIREFTFCTWLRFFDLSGDQSVFTYVANSNNRVVRLWVDSGGRHIKISMNGRAASSALVDINKNTWRHICLSYQSDFGAWALYVDGRLASCEAAQSLYGFVIPGGGSVIIGYGITDSGIPSGLDGEVFGANMILSSTIERNYTIKGNPEFRQKSFTKNKLIANNNIKYIVLGNMSRDNTQESAETSNFPLYNTTRSFIRFTTPHSTVEHDVGLDLSSVKMKLTDSSNEKEILDFSLVDKSFKGNGDKVKFWNLMSQTGNTNNFKGRNSKSTELSGSGTQELPAVSEYETPPPPSSFQGFVRSHGKMRKPLVIPYFELKESGKVNSAKSVSYQNTYGLFDIEKPPPPEKNVKVYGQWTSSQFANSVLNYIKNFNNQQREQKKVSPTIPLIKLSDSFPYASDLRLTKIRPPYKVQRKNIIEKRINKREVKHPEINVEILHDDIRSEILESHAKTQAHDVKIINRGVIKNNKDHRIYRDVDNQLSGEILKPRPFVASSKININKLQDRLNRYRNSNLMTILPFLKSTEYFIDGNKKTISSDDVYTKSLSNANKWHNVKSFSNDYTPRHINMGSTENQVTIDTKEAEAKKKYPSLRLKYMPDNHKIVKSFDEDPILNGRTMAIEISNLTNPNADSISILKYNHGFLPKHAKKSPGSGKNVRHKITSTKNDFNQNVKIGNALNERFIIGNNGEQNQQSFIGGDETIPDINRYRSDIDSKGENVPPSLGPKICKNVELYDRLFYVQPDGSVDVTQILSPIREKNLGIEFIALNYKVCSLDESEFKQSSLLYIDWNKTPVRLFGGSYPQKTKDLCGFF